MRAFRITILMLILCGTGLAVAGVRIEQAHCIWRIQKHQMKQIALRRQVNAHHLRIARLRSPAQIRSRIDRFELDIYSADAVRKMARARDRSELAVARD